VIKRQNQICCRMNLKKMASVDKSIDQRGKRRGITTRTSPNKNKNKNKHIGRARVQRRNMVEKLRVRYTAKSPSFAATVCVSASVVGVILLPVLILLSSAGQNHESGQTANDRHEHVAKLQEIDVSPHENKWVNPIACLSPMYRSGVCCAARHYFDSSMSCAESIAREKAIVLPQGMWLSKMWTCCECGTNPNVVLRICKRKSQFYCACILSL
jgi:hypothetical protein